MIKKGYAYESEGDVYFRAKKFKGYGTLAHQDLAEMESNAAGRLDDGELARKEDPMDFAVWKGENGDGAIAWNSPWGKGRPGWHIECSVMSTKYLGNHLDIHGGGIDLAFPHHTNEIAQTEAHTGEKFVEKWLHNGFVTVGDENEKMSKSLGNFTTVHELLQQIDDPMVLRFFMATTQYRRPIAYSQKNMDLAARNLSVSALVTATCNSVWDQQLKVQMQISKQRHKKVDAFVEAMDDDFNAQNAMTAVYELIELANLYSQAEEVKTDTVNFVLKQIKDLMNVFGVDGLEQAPLLDADVDALIKERDAARDIKLCSFRRNP